MAKGYWITRVNVSTGEGDRPNAVANSPIFKKYGAKFVVRGRKFTCPEGSACSRNVVVEFPDYATALVCYNSLEYSENIKVR